MTALNIRQLQYFLCVAKYLNFSKAAKELFVAQPALSQQIAELEKALEVKLFARSSRAVSLTPAGELLREEGEIIVARINKVTEQVRQAGQGRQGFLQIGYVAAPVKSFLPALLARFHARFPTVSLHPVQYNIGPLHQALLDGIVDVGLTMSFDVERSENLDWRAIEDDDVREGLSFVMRVDSPLNRHPLDMSALAKAPFVLIAEKESPRFYPLVMELCKARGFTPSIVDQKSRMEEVLMLVDSEIGVSLVSSSAKSYGMPNLVFHELEEPQAKIDIVAAWKKGNENQTLKLFLDELWGEKR